MTVTTSKETSVVECHDCGVEYAQVGQHWSKSSCEYPHITDYQLEILRGLMMGDGTLNRGCKNPRLEVQCIVPQYLQFLDEKFGDMSTGVSLSQTAEESASGAWGDFSSDVKNYSDVYRWKTRCHPAFADLNWYSSGSKVWPEDIELTPTVLKHWYCGDGTWDNSQHNSAIFIGMANESENVDKVSEYFESANLPPPANYDTYERNEGGVNCIAQFNSEQSHELWRHMGEPPPGYEYKWPQQYHNGS